MCSSYVRNAKSFLLRRAIIAARLVELEDVFRQMFIRVRAISVKIHAAFQTSTVVEFNTLCKCRVAFQVRKASIDCILHKYSVQIITHSGSHLIFSVVVIIVPLQGLHSIHQNPGCLYLSKTRLGQQTFRIILRARYSMLLTVLSGRWRITAISRIFKP